jgi:hypothetical protein
VKHKSKTHVANVEQPKQTREEKKAAAIAAVKGRAEQQALYFFHDPMRKPYATVPVAGHRETWRIGSKDFRIWVKQVLYDQIGEAPEKWVKATVEEFETYAICRGPMHEVHVRIAEQNGATYVDLGNAEWQVLEITSTGWKILNESPVKFRRPGGLTALPYPKDGGTLRDAVRFLNIRPQSEVLLLTWLTYSLRCGTPYPVIALSGVQGAGKSTITKVLRELIDPSTAALTTVPKSERDIAIAASNSHLIAMDNLSEISPALSDVICRVATGGGFRCRELYTNDDETILTYRRPVIINGIEELPIRPDLLDRSIIIHVEPISEDRRQDERTFWADFEMMRPLLFGAMLDVIQAGLQNVGNVKLILQPRMADFARWGVATEQAAGFPAGTFMAAYDSNRDDADAAAIESSPIAKAIYYFMHAQPLTKEAKSGPARLEFRGTALNLLHELNKYLLRGSGGWTVSDASREGHPELELLIKHPKFPKTANSLSAEIARIEPNLKKMGIGVVRGRSHSGRYIQLTRGCTPQEVKAEQMSDKQAAYAVQVETVRKEVDAVLSRFPVTQECVAIEGKSLNTVLIRVLGPQYVEGKHEDWLAVAQALQDAGWKAVDVVKQMFEYFDHVQFNDRIPTPRSYTLKVKRAERVDASPATDTAEAPVAVEA